MCLHNNTKTLNRHGCLPLIIINRLLYFVSVKSKFNRDHPSRTSLFLVFSSIIYFVCPWPFGNKSTLRSLPHWFVISYRKPFIEKCEYTKLSDICSLKKLSKTLSQKLLAGVSLSIQLSLIGGFVLALEFRVRLFDLIDLTKCVFFQHWSYPYVLFSIKAENIYMNSLFQK